MKHTVKWGIIGLGNIAFEFAKSFYNVNNADLIAVASTSHKKLAKFKQEFDIKNENLYDDYEKLIEDQNIDIIYIALPNTFHFEWVLKNVEKNKNILVEKPAFLSLKEASIIFNHQNFKNIFSEYVEDFTGYISSSLFVNEEKDKKKHGDFFLKNIASNEFGEFYQNKIWVLEVLFNQKPDINIIKRKLNYLAYELKTTEYYFNEYPCTEKHVKILNISKVEHKNWFKYNRKSFPIINVDNFYIYGSHNNKNYSANKIPIKIDASTAFGTGSHETTKCCLKALTFISRFSKINRILDYGCGTGILGIASKKFSKEVRQLLLI